MFRTTNDSFTSNDESFTSDEGVMIDSDGEQENPFDALNISGINNLSQAHVAVPSVDAEVKAAIESNSILSAQLAAITADLERMRREVEFKDRIIATQESELRIKSLYIAQKDAEAIAEINRLTHDIGMLEKLGL